MFINEDLVEGKVKNSLIKHNQFNSDPDLSDELFKIVSSLLSNFNRSSIEKTGNWLQENNRWLKNENGLLPVPTGTTPVWRNYSRGDIVLSLDFGTSNIGTEIRYPHPGVVLYDQDEDWIIVAPITEAQLDQNRNPIVHPPFEVLARKHHTAPANPREYRFSKHSVIQIDQIRRVSKHRIYNKNSKKLSLNLLNQIDNIILKHFIPQKDALLSRMQSEVSRLEGLNSELFDENRKLLGKVGDLEKELRKYRPTNDADGKISS